MSTENLNNLATILLEYISSQDLQGKKIAVAWSGGLDSTALVMAMKTLCERNKFPWMALYFDHGLRPDGERAQERALVEKIALDYKFDLVIGSWSPSSDFPMGMEAEARESRRQFFLDSVKKHGIHGVFTAHHQQDQAETQLIRLLQGRSYRGLAGIPSRSGLVHHPFLGVDKRLLQSAVEESGAPWWEDSTNQGDGPLRNRVRHHLVPLLNELFPAWKKGLESLGKFSKVFTHQILRSSRSFWKVNDGEWVGNMATLNKYPASMACEIVLEALGQVSDGQRIPRRSVESILSDLKSQSGIRTLPRAYVERKGEFIIIRARLAKNQEIHYFKPVLSGKTLSWCGKRITLHFSESGELKRPKGRVYLLSSAQAWVLNLDGMHQLKAFWDREELTNQVRSLGPVVIDQSGILGFIGSPWGGKDFFSLPETGHKNYFHIDYQ